VPFEWKRLRFVPVVVLGVFAVMLCDYAIRGPNARRRQAAVENALRAIPDPTFSTAINSSSGFKTSGGYAERSL
jgi:hypothetical protein